MSDDQVFGEGHFDVNAAKVLSEREVENVVSSYIHGHAVPAAVQSKRREGKPLAALLRDFPLSFMEVAKALTYGAIKHGAHNWTHLPESAIEEYEHAADRHDLMCWSGELVDAESNLMHEAQALTCRLIAFELRLRYARQNKTNTL